MTTSLLSVATAVPENAVTQKTIAEAAGQAFGGRYSEFGRLSRVFETAGIDQRHLARPVEWYLRPRDWAERNGAYVETARDLFVAAAERALARAGVAAAEIDTVVTISSTGLATPSLEAQVAGRMGFRSDIERVPVFGLGCAGGVSGLSIAARLAEARPGSTILMVAVELCSLAFRLDELTKANIVATALFADGAAACVLKSDDMGALHVEAAGRHTWPDTLSIMGWRVDPEGLGVIFDRAIPPFVEEKLKPALEGILAAADLTLGDIDRLVCHPGGTKVLEALETALALPSGRLDHERAVLADYGNMSAPTVLFVLERLLAEGEPPARLLLTALGPGFTASGVTLKRSPH
ncbi:type III polyketide synthase [Pararhizobium mangrovi]|uniref:Type III polyketide synthase n=2 Tax=Pararhizobium mangrovi TaxID=2590452 RepID=A0A506U611_9HYPH|nr:type III polyketide synthase [Pararhizobium mangrovi]